VKGLNEAANQVDAINKAQCIFIGGGNTFHLLNQLQEKNLVEVIRNRVVNDGVPYLGSSAGTDVHVANILRTCF
jgi:dipeptidase E